MSSRLSPSRIAWAMIRIRSGVVFDSAAITARLRSGSAVLSSTPGISISSKPVRPVSIEASAFCIDSAKLRPMAMTSPTDFMAVVSSGLAPGNFSKAKRGILVTT